MPYFVVIDNKCFAMYISKYKFTYEYKFTCVFFVPNNSTISCYIGEYAIRIKGYAIRLPLPSNEATNYNKDKTTSMDR